jgi:hypothetical protein
MRSAYFIPAFAELDRPKQLYVDITGSRSNRLVSRLVSMSSMTAWKSGGEVLVTLELSGKSLSMSDRQQPDFTLSNSTLTARATEMATMASMVSGGPRLAYPGGRHLAATQAFTKPP